MIESLFEGRSMTFADLALCAPVKKAVQNAGYETPTPIQQQAIPMVLDGHDVFAVAQTGTGKTAAFALPILTDLHEHPPKGKGPTVVILAPTRELAAQIGESFQTYGKHVRARYLTVFGGVSINPQIHALRKGVDVLIGTPGRMIDLMEQRALHLDQVDTLVLDEADRMLDMGFHPQIKRLIAQMPRDRQTLFFSATLPPEIRDLADQILRTPTHVAVAPVSSTAERVEQRRYVVGKASKRKLLRHLLETEIDDQVLIFTRTKRGADRLVKDLMNMDIGAAALHGNKTQGAREKALGAFKNGRNRILVATDIASRGIDISQLPYVVNFDLPDSPETYVHRIGRTGRAGFEGIAITFSTPDEAAELKAIEKLIGQKIPETKDHPYYPGSAAAVADDARAEELSREHGSSRSSAKKHSAPDRGKSATSGSNRSGGSRRGSSQRARSRR